MRRHHNLLSIPSALGGPFSRGSIMRAHGAALVVLEWLGLYTFDARGATFDLDTVTMDRN